MRHRKKDSISTLPQAATTVASAWAPSVDASSTVPAASAESGAVRKCHVCKELVVTYAGLEIKLRALDASSRCGCPSCLLIARVLEEYGVKLTTDDNVYLFVEGESTLKLRFDSLNDKGTTEEFDIFIPQGTTCPWPSIESRRTVLGNSTVEAAADQVKQWLEDCNTNHGDTICDDASIPKPLPTRLLRIRGYHQISLYTPSQNERGLYVCLSHCWGGSVALQTTRATELEFHDHINWDLLPSTFKDAVDLTWHLGLEYLWIDSLSILQDDLDDWRHEGSKMASIYSNSFVTLAATKSPNCHGGFYTFSDYNKVTKMHKIACEGGKLYTIYSRKSLPHRTFDDAELPLLTRAWAFQERLLSPRIVHFTDEELFWECTRIGICECKTSSSRSLYGLSKSRFSAYLSTNTSLLPKGLTSTYWYEIVSSYTALNLTSQTDALPALQGVVKRMQLVRNCSYYAGLWEDTIIEDLLWYSNTLKVSTYQPPAWSWASRGSSVGRYGFPPGSQEPLRKAQVVSVSVTPKGLDPTGEISAGVLTLRGRRFGAQIVPKHRETSDVHAQVCLRVKGLTMLKPITFENMHLDIMIDEVTEVECLEVYVDAGGNSIMLCLRSVESTANENGYDATDDIPTFERIGINFIGPNEAAKFLWSEDSTVRLV